MNESKHVPGLDEVLTRYAQAAQGFDSQVLQSFLAQYPEHAEALHRFAHVQLTSAPATPEEIDHETLTDDDMLPCQSKLLQRMQQRNQPTAPASADAVGKLATIQGRRGQEAARVVLGSDKHGEDLLLVSVLELGGQVRDVPDWFYSRLGSFLNVPAGLLQASQAQRGQRAIGTQRFSAKGKPVEPAPTSWEQLVGDCITDDSVKRQLLQHGPEA